MIACQFNKFEIAKYLLESGIDINDKTIYEANALILAAHSKNIELIKYLVSNGVDVYQTTTYGHNALFASVMVQSLDLVQYFVEKGIDINCKCYNNMRPIDLARTVFKNKEIYEYLKKKDDELNEKEKSTNSKNSNKYSFRSFINKIFLE
ncbi:ankyrin [Neocallimastix californiae]|uniref:Ankyrin n=1 Tax=Neocallimastix californiae TaxID=1754190 RepID=A0A1Y2AY92_9FUNG|nr:ankyrin [Neocallimastix californiae]|eukprot:ORY27424.1 ankyrin [Neocallimastix californiae]